MLVAVPYGACSSISEASSAASEVTGRVSRSAGAGLLGNAPASFSPPTPEKSHVTDSVHGTIHCGQHVDNEHGVKKCDAEPKDDEMRRDETR